MKRVIFFGALLTGTVLLFGCGSKTTVNEVNFAQAIDVWLADKPICLSVKQWPVVLGKPVLNPAAAGVIDPKQQKQMDSLKSLGLVEERRSLVNNNSMFGPKTYEIATYAPTPEGEKWMKAVNTAVGTMQKMCIANQSVDKIVRWEQPPHLNGAGYLVTFTIKSNDVAAWASNPEIAEAFDTARSLSGREDQRVVTLASDGWRVSQY